MTDYPKTVEEYWELCNEHKDDLRALVSQFHPAYRRSNLMPITAYAPELICIEAREAIARKEQTDPIVEFNRMLESRSPDMPTLLNQVWFGIPESIEAHSLPAFHVLCDLCSEGYLLEPEEQPHD